MNLTNTKRWNEFEEWYFNNDYHDDIELYSDESRMDRLPSFVSLKFEFQEGVYRKFIESFDYKYGKIDNRHYLISEEIKESFNSFQDLVECFFTN